jgi:SAM-dependent methyltransferase
MSIRESWIKELPSEIKFWEDWLGKRKSLAVAKYYHELINVDLIKKIITDIEEPVKILDVGPGVSSFLSYIDFGKKIELYSIDALADEYTKLCQNIDRIDIPIQCEAEYMDILWPDGFFDFIHIRNSLDHCFDPIMILQKALLLLKKTGTLYLGHVPNVKRCSGYTGLHFWDIDAIDGQLTIDGQPVGLDCEIKLLPRRNILVEFLLNK